VKTALRAELVIASPGEGSDSCQRAVDHRTLQSYNQRRSDDEQGTDHHSRRAFPLTQLSHEEQLTEERFTLGNELGQ
jgi:hypothetical protein